MTIKYRELKRRYELDGPKKTTAHLSEALQSSQLKPEDFSIRDLAEALVPDGHEWVTDDVGVLLSVAQSCLQDRFWKCRMTGLKLVAQLGEKGRELLPLIEPLVQDDLPEIRAWAGQITTALQKSQSQY